MFDDDFGSFGHLGDMGHMGGFRDNFGNLGSHFANGADIMSHSTQSSFSSTQGPDGKVHKQQN